MFEVTALFSAVLILTTFTAGGIKLLETIGLEAESPATVFQEMVPRINTTNHETTNLIQN